VARQSTTTGELAHSDLAVVELFTGERHARVLVIIMEAFQPQGTCD
jgi:hypothetical protein